LPPNRNPDCEKEGLPNQVPPSPSQSYTFSQMTDLEVTELESGAFKAFAQAFAVLIESNGSV